MTSRRIVGGSRLYVIVFYLALRAVRAYTLLCLVFTLTFFVLSTGFSHITCWCFRQKCLGPENLHPLSSHFFVLRALGCISWPPSLYLLFPSFPVHLDLPNFWCFSAMSFYVLHRESLFALYYSCSICCNLQGRFQGTLLTLSFWWYPTFFVWDSKCLLDSFILFSMSLNHSLIASISVCLYVVFRVNSSHIFFNSLSLQLLLIWCLIHVWVFYSIIFCLL